MNEELKKRIESEIEEKFWSTSYVSYPNNDPDTVLYSGQPHKDILEYVFNLLEELKKEKTYETLIQIKNNW